MSLDEAKVRARVEKVSSIERIKANVDKALGDKIREYKLDGVMVDEDYTVITHTKRWPPKCWVLRAATIRALLG